MNDQFTALFDGPKAARRRIGTARPSGGRPAADHLRDYFDGFAAGPRAARG